MFTQKSDKIELELIFPCFVYDSPLLITGSDMISKKKYPQTKLYILEIQFWSVIFHNSHTDIVNELFNWIKKYNWLVKTCSLRQTGNSWKWSFISIVGIYHEKCHFK